MTSSHVLFRDTKRVLCPRAGELAIGSSTAHAKYTYIPVSAVSTVGTVYSGHLGTGKDCPTY